MSEEEMRNIIYLKNKPISSCKDLHKYFIGRHNEPIIVYLTPKFEIEFENNFNKLEYLEEEKRLILKDIKEWIACAKNEQLEDYVEHREYWETFETILRKIFTKYNIENINDDDLKYNHYLEKENEDKLINEIELLEQENKKYKEVINKAIKYIEENKQHEYRNGNLDEYYLELNEKEMTELLDILKEVEHE